ncbi:choice-of-anchor I family protein [Vibrio sp. SCSIO 43136]|uniref:choice-of-anchor I family protein n=1 Tax=Vibrio sp. SCSIO 43136 TaxID=2819101 RepID=UPI0020762C15|nr:choice-of-anchor I family protein [Vibrio sp. SCSIO 43136]USD67699.1 choice-of-anchor I family protein [Vibrio sp. SCSIO 43136]
MKKLSILTLALTATLSTAASAHFHETALIARYQSGIYGEGATEIIDYDKLAGKAYVINGATNRVDILDLSNLKNTPVENSFEANNLSAVSFDIPAKVSLSNGSEVTLGGANSLAIHNKLMAIAVANDNKQAPGVVLFYQLSDHLPKFHSAVQVGALPDMVTFAPNGRTVVVANEGEPSKDYKIDPEGSVSLITVTNGEPNHVATELSFKHFESQKPQLLEQGFKFASPEGTSLAQDIEPEYITVSQDSRTAWVTLQENNAVAKMDLLNAKITNVYGLGLKDFGKAENAIDASDKDGMINIKPRQGVYGLYQPDTISSYSVNGKTYLVTANEGDARDYWFSAANEAECLQAGGLEFDEEDGCLGYSEETRAGKLKLAAGHPQQNNLDKADLGRLKVTTAMGDTNGDGLYEKVVAYGARSFSIWDENGNQVFDSAGEIEAMLAKRFPEAFNSNEVKNKKDNRSDDKGAEPEGLAIGEIDGRFYAFVGLERMGGFVIYDITTPANAKFIDYVVNRDFKADFEIDDDASPVALKGDYKKAGDLAPEGMKFISKKDSPTKLPLLLVANEISGTVSVYAMK